MAKSSKAKSFIGIELGGSPDDVIDMLDALDSAFSPTGMETFMSGRVVPHFRERAEARFASEGDDASGRWAPLTATTVRIRETSGFPGTGPINVRTGDLEDYITQGRGTVTHEGTGSTALHYPQAGSPGGIRAKKLRTAQLGEGASARRPVLAIGERDLMDVSVQLMYFIQSWVGGQGGR